MAHAARVQHEYLPVEISIEQVKETTDWEYYYSLGPETVSILVGEITGFSEKAFHGGNEKEKERVQALVEKISQKQSHVRIIISPNKESPWDRIEDIFTRDRIVRALKEKRKVTAELTILADIEPAGTMRRCQCRSLLEFHAVRIDGELVFQVSAKDKERLFAKKRI
jgi:hypothetical protein